MKLENQLFETQNVSLVNVNIAQHLLSESNDKVEKIATSMLSNTTQAAKHRIILLLYTNIDPQTFFKVVCTLHVSLARTTSIKNIISSMEL